MFKVNSKEEAWRKVDKIFPTDYIKDENRSEQAGYPVYVSTVEGHEDDYISDLGCRLEVNISEGNQSINIWISETELGHDISVTVVANSGEKREYNTYEDYAKDFRFFWSSGLIMEFDNSTEHHFCKMIESLRELDEAGMTISSRRNGLLTTFRYNKFRDN